MSSITASTLKFLNALKESNNRDWFLENKATFTKEHERVILFAEAVINEMKKHDLIETASGKKCIYRIYRDVRFSKDKTPYKTHFSGYLKRATVQLRGGYYFHIEPNNCFVGGGFWSPEPKDLLRIRKEIAADDYEIREIINHPTFIDTFGELKGNKLKTAPRSFDKNHKAVDLLRYKQFLLIKKFDDSAVLQPNFYKDVVSVFTKMRPFFDYMSAVLTTDENGVPLFDE